MREYPLFIAPVNLADRVPSAWTTRDAEFYREWLLGVLLARTDALLDFFATPVDPDVSSELLVVGAHATRALRDRTFATESPHGWELTSAGYALCADLGLLVARRLLEQHPGRLRWETVLRPKRDMSFHLPVLVGFSTKLYLEPVTGSIAEAYAVLRGARGPDAWQRIYVYWSARVEA